MITRTCSSNVSGVKAFAAKALPPLPLENPFGGPFTLESAASNDTYSSGLMFVSEHYFEVFRIALLQGRLFTERDSSAAPNVDLIDEALAEGASGKYHWRSVLAWPNGNPLGQVVTRWPRRMPPWPNPAASAPCCVREGLYSSHFYLYVILGLRILT